MSTETDREFELTAKRDKILDTMGELKVHHYLTSRTEVTEEDKIFAEYQQQVDDINKEIKTLRN